MKYIVGIDNGSQSTKVCIFDLNGNVVSEGRVKLKPYLLPEPGYVIHPDDDIWDSIKAATRIAMDSFIFDEEDIIAVGLCTIRCCRAILKLNGELAYPVQSWMDSRVSENYDHSIANAGYITTSSGYITRRLTGNNVDTYANYVGAWPIDYEKRNWIEDKEQFSSFNIPREMLFDLVAPNDKLGEITKTASEVTGLPQGIPVYATANDKAVEALGAGLLRDDTVLLSLGTYICCMMQGDGIYDSPQNFWTNFADLPEKYLYESSGIRRGMWTVSWVRDLVFDHGFVTEDEIGMSYENYLNYEATKIPAGCEGLITLLDFLAPPDKPFKKGVMVGLDGRHTRAHMYRSVFEAIAMNTKIHYDAMVSELGAKPEKIIVAGGGSNSDLMMQIVADVYGIPAVRNEMNGCASLGAAINASIGSGVYENFALATEKMVRYKDEFKPNMENHALYDQTINKVYNYLLTQNDELLKKLYEIYK